MTRSSEVTADVDSSAPTALAHYQREARWVVMHKRALDILLSKKLIWALAAVGVLLRIILYLDNRSLWFDEAALGLNLLERPFSHPLSPLDFGQGAPVGFLMVERLAGEVLGYSEYSLRLFPLVCGLAAVIGFVALARRVLTPLAAPLAVALFGVAQGPTYYSSELKPYAVDVAATVFLLLAGVVLIERTSNSRIALGIGVGSAVLLAFSFASVLVLVAVAIVLVFEAVRRRDQPSRAHALVLAVWVAAAVGAILLALERLSAIRHGFAEAADAAIGQGSVLTLHSLNVFASNLSASLGLSQEPPWSQLQKLAALVAVVGAGSLLIRAPARGLLVVLPVPVTFAVAALGQYPLTYRTTLFLVPVVVLALAEGIARLSAWGPGRWSPIIAAVLVATVVVGPAWWSVNAAFDPPGHEEIKPVLTHVRDRWRPGDTLYLQYGALYAFLYYENCGCLSLTGSAGARLWPLAANPPGDARLWRPVKPTSRAVLVGPNTDDQTLQVNDLNNGLRNRTRVWFVYSHVSDAERKFIQRRLLRRLDEMGTRTATLDEPGAHAYLYTLTRDA